MTSIQTSISKKTIIANTVRKNHSTGENSYSMNMSITVKAYLQTADDSQEIRRFAVDQGASTSYEYLSTKITQVFPSIGRSDSFTLSYRDREGDLIAFSNDNELSHALGQLSEEILRVYVTLTCEKSHCDDSKYCEQLFNPEVICGGCEVRDCEPRFKCVVCPDYYLCKGCEEKGLHPEHEMIQNRELQIGRSHKGGFSFRPGLWQFVFGEHRVDDEHQMWRQGDQEQYERSPEDDTLAEEGASGNLIEGSNPQKGCLNHAGEADMPCHSGIGEKARKRRGKEQSGKCLGHPRGRGPRGCRGRGGQDGRNERRKVQATEYAPNEDASNDNKDSSQDDTMNGDNTDENATVHQW